jgi:LmbE family N-acetylglucosaminyl deacetylase
MKKILFVSVHPDDETLGCGGTIMKLKNLGSSLHWLNLTDIDNDHPFGFSKETIVKRQSTTIQVKNTYGFDTFTNLKYHTMLLDKYNASELIKDIGQVITNIEPDTIYLTNRSDVHSDHRIAFDAVYACTKSFRYPYVKDILMYETLSETEFAPALIEKAFIPNTFVDISKYMEDKIRIMKMYDTEIMPDPLPRSIHAIKGLAAYRGSRIGVNYAEAFQQIYRVM